MIKTYVGDFETFIKNDKEYFKSKRDSKSCITIFGDEDVLSKIYQKYKDRRISMLEIIEVCSDFEIEIEKFEKTFEKELKDINYVNTYKLSSESDKYEQFYNKHKISFFKNLDRRLVGIMNDIIWDYLDSVNHDDDLMEECLDTSNFTDEEYAYFDIRMRDNLKKHLINLSENIIFIPNKKNNED